MLFLIWIVLGMILGSIWIGLTRKDASENAALAILLGICGAVLGGMLFTLFGTTSWTMVNLYNLTVAMAGALVFLMAYHSIKQIN